MANLSNLSSFLLIDSSGGKIAGNIQPGSSTEFGYVDSNGNFQPVNLSGDTPVNSGAARSVDLKMFLTGVPLPDGLVGGSSVEFYKCASVDTSTKTWTGYKAILENGVYSFEETFVEGLTYDDNFVPSPGKIYDNGCTLVIDSLFMPVEIDFGAYSNISRYGQAPIPASFSTLGKANDAYEPYRTTTVSDQYAFTGPTENLKSWSRIVVNDAAFGIRPSSVFIEVHAYTDLSEQYTVTSIVIEGSNDMENWDELGREEGVNDTGAWAISCTPKQLFYKALRAVFTSAQEGNGAVLWKVRYSGIYYECDKPTASPYNPSGLESDGYSITYSYSWWDETRPWKAFNFGANASTWGSNITNSGVGQWLAWENQTAKCIKRYQLRAGDDNTGVGFALQGYDETNGEWVNIDERIADSSDGILLFDCSSNTGRYKKHRIICTQMGTGSHFQLNHIAAWE